MNKIGLFPLGIVLFPESVMPLHIFEERYRKLIKICFDSHSYFGINLMASSKIHDVGCSAQVSDIMKIHDDGKMDIIIAGIRRYKLTSFVDGEAPYYIGDVEYFDDITEPIDERLLFQCLSFFNDIALSIKAIKIEPIDPAGIQTKTPSFVIAQKSGLTLIQRQELLEMRSENARLSVLLEYLKKLTPLVKEAEFVANVIKNDGYLKPDDYIKD